jgi:hypothetical protein
MAQEYQTSRLPTAKHFTSYYRFLIMYPTFGVTSPARVVKFLQQVFVKRLDREHKKKTPLCTSNQTLVFRCLRRRPRLAPAIRLRGLSMHRSHTRTIFKGYEWVIEKMVGGPASCNATNPPLASFQLSS